MTSCVNDSVNDSHGLSGCYLDNTGGAPSEAGLPRGGGAGPAAACGASSSPSRSDSGSPAVVRHRPRGGADPQVFRSSRKKEGAAKRRKKEYSAELDDDAFVRHTRPWGAVRDGTALQPGTAEEERALYRKIWKLPSRRRQYYLGKWRPNPLAIADVPRGILEAAQDAWDSKIYFASGKRVW